MTMRKNPAIAGKGSSHLIAFPTHIYENQQDRYMSNENRVLSDIKYYI